ncbi:MAG: glycosyltransferase family 2 protein [Chloroflexi bacterium]|nr:glycosyltransferase family 2 protein [Chloroflexota bacterium]
MDSSQELAAINDSVRPALTVVIPAYNEEKRLPDTLARVAAYFRAHAASIEILVVDDGSSDGTADFVASFAQANPEVRLIRNPHRGKGYTVRTGVLGATGARVLVCDADLATPIEEEQKLSHWLDDGYAVAIASREGLGARRIGEPAYRHIMGRVFNLITRLIAIGGFEDTQCGFKMFEAGAARDIFGRVQLYGDNAAVVRGAAVTAYDVEVIFLAVKLGYKVKEVPTEWRYGTATKVNPLTDSMRNFGDVLRVRINDWRGKYNTK